MCSVYVRCACDCTWKLAGVVSAQYLLCTLYIHVGLFRERLG